MSLKTSLVNTANSVGSTISAHAPEILLGVGIFTGVATVVSAIKSTLKVEEVIDEAKEEIDEVKSSEDFDKKELTKVYFKTGAKLAKLYYPTVLLGATSTACILYSNGMLKQRTAQTIAAYNTLDAIFKKYRGNVIEKYGEAEDHKLRYGLKDEKVETVEYDENGNEVKSKKKVTTIPSDFLNTSEYSRLFTKYREDGEENPLYSKIQDSNALFLQNTQRYANDLLNLRGHVFLNEVYDMLGFKRTESGQVVGWVKGEGDGVVRFGIDNIYRAIADGKLTYGEAILLEFNVQGVIIDKI